MADDAPTYSNPYLEDRWEQCIDPPLGDGTVEHATGSVTHVVVGVEGLEGLPDAIVARCRGNIAAMDETERREIEKLFTGFEDATDLSRVLIEVGIDIIECKLGAGRFHIHNETGKGQSKLVRLLNTDPARVFHRLMSVLRERVEKRFSNISSLMAEYILYALFFSGDITLETELVAFLQQNPAILGLFKTALREGDINLSHCDHPVGYQFPELMKCLGFYRRPLTRKEEFERLSAGF